jgi:hypothetical protein
MNIDYAERLARGLLALSALSFPIAIVAIVTALRSRGRTITVYALCVAIGAALAAIDANNHRGWNPGLIGAPFVALALPLVLFFAVPPGHPKRTNIAVMAAVAAIPIALLMSSIGAELIRIAYQRGWPVSW